MKNFNIKLYSLGFLLALLIGCKAAPVYNITQAEFNAPRGTSLNTVEQAILKGARLAGWRAKSVGRRKIAATYSAKKGTLLAIVDITFNRNNYSISYRDSKNLKYVDRSNEPQPSENVFSEYNPFKDDQDQTPASPPATIHKVYNKWVMMLEKKINASLMNLGISSASRTTITKQQPTTSYCSDSPNSSLNGQARVSRASVNLRSGASTKCAIIGKVTQSETFSLLGKKNNWYYVSRSRGDSGWLYAPLVQTLSTQTKQTATVAKASVPPPPPAPPRKKISIAVIEFKTLNKEAQKISLGDLISETFTSALVNSRGFKIIERDQLDKVIKEMEMSQTGFIDTTDAVEIGKMLHADAIITGSVALLAGQIQLNARIIDIESAYVISAETKTTRYTLQNINILVNDIVIRLSASLSKN